MNSQVEQVNALLFQGEPANISIDEHSGYTGYKPQAVVDAMNEVLFGAWGFEEVSSEIEPGDKGSLAVAQVRVWLKDIEFRPVAWGQNRVTRGDIGDARKGAQTDAIKKALSYFSIYVPMALILAFRPRGLLARGSGSPFRICSRIIVRIASSAISLVSSSVSP